MIASNAHVSFKALDAHRGQISLTVDNLPLKVYCSQERITEGVPSDNQLFVELSDGYKQTFAVNMYTVGTVGEIDFPQSPAVHSKILGPAIQYDNGEIDLRYLDEEQCIVSRTGNTLTWQFTMPQWSYDLRNTRYISYLLSQDLMGENENIRSTVYEILDNGELKTAGDGHLWWYTGFVMTYEEAKDLAER